MQSTFVKIISLLTLIANSHAESFKECKNAAEGTFVAVDNDCLSYVYCLGEESFTDMCPIGTYFNAQQQQCSIDEDGSQCTTFKGQIVEEVNQQSVSPAQGLTEHVATTTISTIASVLQSTLSSRPQCKPTIDEYFPYQHRCEYYYRCMSGYLSIMRCSLGYGWDFLQEKCMPLKEAQCFKAARAQVFRC